MQAKGEVEFSVSEVSALLSIPLRTMKRKCATGLFQAIKRPGPGGMEYRIFLEALPEPAQVRYWVGQLKALTLTERRAYLDAQFLPEGMARKVAQAAGIPRKRCNAAPEPWTQEEFEEKTAWFNKLPMNAQEEAIRRTKLLWTFEDMEVLEGVTRSDAAKDWAKAQGESLATLYRWRSGVAHLERHQWCYGLVPERRKGNMPGAPKADMAPELWAFFLENWLTQSKPALRPIYRRAVALANARGLALPSEKTVLRRLQALPLPVRTLAREGEKAHDALYPPVRHDYTTLAIHEMWNSDGHVLDLHARWEDGSVSRPLIVAFMDVRTRVFLGWAIGKSESAHLVRQALANAMERSRALPTSAYLDNGRAFASKEFTGGQKNRFRFKVKDGEMQGTLTMAGVNVIWARPYNGQAKPIESRWRVLTEAARRPEFVGAYCGNKPDNRPDEHDVKNAVDIALVERIFREEIEASNARAHRGQGMDGLSPNALYAQLMAHAVVRQPTAGQIRRCKLAPQQVKLTRSGEINLLGNRYGSDACAALARVTYTAYYDPNDTTAPIELWDGNDLVAVVPEIASTGFADREAAQDAARARKRRIRATREQDEAIRAEIKAADRTTPRRAQTEPGAPLPRPKVPRLAHLGASTTKPPTNGADDELTPEYMEEYRQALARGEALRYGS